MARIGAQTAAASQNWLVLHAWCRVGACKDAHCDSLRPRRALRHPLQPDGRPLGAGIVIAFSDHNNGGSDLRIFGSTDLRIYGSTDLRIYGSTDLLESTSR